MRPSSRLLSSVAVLLLLTAAGCALYSDVVISQLTVIPGNIERGADIEGMMRRADYLRAVELGPQIDARPHKNADDLLLLGTAELAAARYDSARQHLRAALDLNPYRTTYAKAAWGLSQVEYMQNNYETALEWANEADKHGINVMRWHLSYLEQLSKMPVYRFSGLPSDEVPLKIGRPDVPRIETLVNRSPHTVTTIIDSGAVLSIMSERLATSLPVTRLPIAHGVFYGLLGEPINVGFGIIESLEIGAIVLENVPIAIMPDDKMRFLVTDKKEFRIDFLLGANLLKEFRIDLNYSRDRVIFTRLMSRDRIPAIDQNLFFDGFRPHVRGTVNKHGWYLFVIDTGSEVTYLNEAQVRALPISAFAPRIHGATLQGLGGSRKRGTKLENVEIGVDKWAGSFRTIPLYMGEGNERAVGIVGENYLKNFDVVMDFGRMRVDLKRH